MPYGGGLSGNVDPQAPDAQPKPVAPPEPLVNNPKPLGYGGFEPFMDAMMMRQLMFGVNPQGEQMTPQFNILQPPPGLPTVGYNGPMQLPTPPTGGMPPPQSR